MCRAHRSFPGVFNTRPFLCHLDILAVDKEPGGGGGEGAGDCLTVGSLRLEKKVEGKQSTLTTEAEAPICQLRPPHPPSPPQWKWCISKLDLYTLGLYTNILLLIVWDITHMRFTFPGHFHRLIGEILEFIIESFEIEIVNGKWQLTYTYTFNSGLVAQIKRKRGSLQLRVRL